MLSKYCEGTCVRDMEERNAFQEMNDFWWPEGSIYVFSCLVLTTLLTLVCMWHCNYLQDRLAWTESEQCMRQMSSRTIPWKSVFWKSKVAMGVVRLAWKNLKWTSYICTEPSTICFTSTTHFEGSSTFLHLLKILVSLKNFTTRTHCNNRWPHNLLFCPCSSP